MYGKSIPLERTATAFILQTFLNAQSTCGQTVYVCIYIHQFTYVHVTFCAISCDRAAQTEANGVFESKREVQRARFKVSV